MAKNFDILVEKARQRLDYNPETGVFRWLCRDPSTFPTVEIGRAWNSLYAGKVAGSRNSDTGYWMLCIDNQRILGHRMAIALSYGSLPDGEVDHINGDRSDNRLANLRVVTISENRRNTSIPARNTSGVMGISQRRGKWRAYISAGGKDIHLGHFGTKEEAAAARKGAERALGFHPNHGARPAAYSKRNSDRR